MADIDHSFVEWVCTQALEGYKTEASDSQHVRIASDAATGVVNLYDMGDDPTVVELRVERTEDEETTFFLHFELDDLARAKDLYTEMADALRDLASHQTTHVLLCCTSGMTTGLMARKMCEVAKAISLDMDFEAKPVDDALRDGANYAAVLLAPQVGHRRQEFVDALPQQVVYQIPAKTFAAFDAGAAVRQVMDALRQRALAAESAKSDLRLVRKLGKGHKVLTMTAVATEQFATISWRVYLNGEVILEDRVLKRSFSYRDIEDVLSALRLSHTEDGPVEAIGIAVPGVAFGGVVSHIGFGLEDYDLGARLEARYGVPVVVENNVRAGAVGCYVTQDEYDSVALHTQHAGQSFGGQGNVVDGKPLRGASGFAGEIVGLGETIEFGMDRFPMAWDPDGTVKLAARYLLSNIAVAQPEAVYVAASLLPDMDELREELSHYMPERYIPQLIAVEDYEERVFLGTLALCLQALA